MLFCQSVDDPVVTLRQLTDSIIRSEGEEAKVEGLLRQAEIYFDHLYELDKADSVFREAMRWAESTNRTDLNAARLPCDFYRMPGIGAWRSSWRRKPLKSWPNWLKQHLDTESRFEAVRGALHGL
jgi:hypothetical protein